MVQSASKIRVPSRRDDSPDSAEVLLLTAERLYAERGLDAVSMREIAREAEQKNNSALHYHFGSKEALVRAILNVRMAQVETRRNIYLDQCLAAKREGVRVAIEALIRPMAEGLVSRNASNYYNRFLAASRAHSDVDIVTLTAPETEVGFRRVYAMLSDALPALAPVLLRQRYLTSLGFIVFSLADFERLKSRRTQQHRGFDMERAIENLIDMVAAAMAAPVSQDVEARMSEREQAGHDPD